jgi:hypothetical protein
MRPGDSSHKRKEGRGLLLTGLLLVETAILLDTAYVSILRISVQQASFWDIWALASCMLMSAIIIGLLEWRAVAVRAYFALIIVGWIVGTVRLQVSSTLPLVTGVTIGYVVLSVLIIRRKWHLFR